MLRTFVWAATAALTIVTVAPRAAAFADDAAACSAAGADAEREMLLPPGLLLAVGRVESGRLDSKSGHVVPWPWTIDAAGDGQSFGDMASALSTTRALLARGVASIDIGCFQVNLAAHPLAFDSLEQAFAPTANAAYAARFLVSLHARLGTWEDAVAAYHSATPQLGGPYRNRVLTEWGRGPGAMLPPQPAQPLIRVMVWVSAQSGVHVWTPTQGGDGANIIRLTAAPTMPTVHQPPG